MVQQLQIAQREEVEARGGGGAIGSDGWKHTYGIPYQNLDRNRDQGVLLLYMEIPRFLQNGRCMSFTIELVPIRARRGEVGVCA